MTHIFDCRQPVPRVREACNPRLAVARVVFVTTMPLFTWTMAQARETNACGCCAEDGQRIETSDAWRPEERIEIDRIRFSEDVRLYMTAGDPEDYAKGIRDPFDRYTMAVSRKRDQWTMMLRDASGKTGSLVFTTPKAGERFFIDLRDGTMGGGGGPLLYKELRLRVPLTGTGIFEPGMAGGAKARLVFQGRGNVCTEAEQFTHWTLVVSGPKANYVLFGALAAPAKRP